MQEYFLRLFRSIQRQAYEGRRARKFPCTRPRVAEAPQGKFAGTKFTRRYCVRRGGGEEQEGGRRGGGECAAAMFRGGEKCEAAVRRSCSSVEGGERCAAAAPREGCVCNKRACVVVLRGSSGVLCHFCAFVFASEVRSVDERCDTLLPHALLPPPRPPSLCCHRPG